MASSSPMLDRLIGDEQRRKDEKEARRARYNQIAINIILILLLAAWAVGLLRQWFFPSAVVEEVQIANLQALGSTRLCPGETLTLRYTFQGDGAGLLVADATTSIAETGETVVPSRPWRIIYPGGGEQPYTDDWPVTALPAGAYQRNVSISSPARSTAFAEDSITFTIRDDCP